MIVLWILLGLLAVLLLLLCLPVTLGVSLDSSDAPTADQPYLTEEILEQIDALGLENGDAAVLRGMVQDLGARPAAQQQQIAVWVKVLLLLKIPLSPMKPKKEAPAPPKKPKPDLKPEQKPKKERARPSVQELLGLAKTALSCAGPPLRMVLGDICLHRLQLYRQVAAGDTAQTALDAQKQVSAVYGLLAVLQNVIRVKRADIRIRPVFTGEEPQGMVLRFRLSLHPIVLLGAGLRFVLCFGRKLLRQKFQSAPGKGSPDRAPQKEA